ncbi:hypothetical protein KQI88_10765 [Alkaliphilus sp. MSJ-5]|uniref:Uncharacterized protein n=1 Tax=Alkaliphilus flagellatus TaxID=2841507 RepID=A0ABS6G333_9FIRM|nr:hypothetical protein [Alkaliphilus flagellatus]MBU5676898.1 hypothetical protein [Alkaliphilus flagellatus]
MSTGQLVILTFVIIFLFMFAVGNIEYSLPFFQRLKFDNVCNRYLAIIQAEGGLNTLNRNSLVLELEDRGFTNVNISAPTKVSWNSEAVLRVEADYTFKTTTGDIEKKENTRKVVYENKTRVMTLER